MRVLITVKAAPNPSETYGETVCIAGIRLDLDAPGWVRLYPVNFRVLESDKSFAKYEVISLQARPATRDPRAESYRPVMETVTRETFLRGWEKRRPHITEHIHESACELLENVRNTPGARSLAPVRPKKVTKFEIKQHPGWTAEEQRKINRYVDQETLFDSGPRTALEAPRFKAWYHYLCHSNGCKGHAQGLIDWEFVALQRRLLRDYNHDDRRVEQELRNRFFDQICRADNEVIFYLGNQAKRPRTFMVLGVAYPKR